MFAKSEHVDMEFFLAKKDLRWYGLMVRNRKILNQNIHIWVLQLVVPLLVFDLALILYLFITLSYNIKWKTELLKYTTTCFRSYCKQFSKNFYTTFVTTSFLGSHIFLYVYSFLLTKVTISYGFRPTLKNCLFPIHRPGEIKNSHEPPAGRNVFFAISLAKKIYN